MKAYDIISKKKYDQTLSEEEIKFMVSGFTNGEIPDYQMSAFLMAICINGMNDEETFNLTMAMRDSGDILDLDGIDGIKVDKHSTGGVGDKISLILSPIMAALGVKVAKMSGRGLGHTGGTIDKLESIDGFTTDLTKNDFINNVNDIGIAIASQTANLAPADKKIYALRDVTATVDCIPLIASSIMSKKLAAGADCIVIDIKCGNGAFMKNIDDAKKLADTMVTIGKSAGKRMACIITDMNQPLGRSVGNYLEVLETIQTLKGEGSEDVLEVVYALGAKMLMFAKKADDYGVAVEMIKECISNGNAYKKFMEFVMRQGGTTNKFSAKSKVAYVKEVSLNKEGYISRFETEDVGRAVQILGGGRETKSSIIDPFVGVLVNKKFGEFISNDTTVFTIYANDEDKLAEAEKKLIDSVSVSSTKTEKLEIIKGTIEG